MGKVKEPRDCLNRVEQRQEQAAKVFATKLDQHARKASADSTENRRNLSRESLSSKNVLPI